MGISYSIYLIKHFGLPLTYAFATLRQSVAGNSPFRGIVFCNLDTSKTDIKIRHHGKNCYPIYFPIWLPQQCSRWTKKRLGDKKVEVTNVLIPSTNACYLTIASSVFFWGGAYGSLPDAAIWWCLRTGGGGILTRAQNMNIKPYYYYVVFIRTKFYSIYLRDWYKILVWK